MLQKLLVTTSSFPQQFDKDDHISKSGGGNFVYILSHGLSRYFDVTVLAPGSQDTKNKEHVGNLSVIRHKQFPFGDVDIAYGSGIPSNIRKNKLLLFVAPFFVLYQLLTIKSLVQAKGITHIHAHWILPQGLIAVLYKILFNKRIKIIVTVHGSDFWSFSKGIRKHLLLFILRHVNRVTVSSLPIKEGVEQLGIKKDIHIYPMGVDTSLFISQHENTPKKPNKQTLLFVGTVVEMKGVRYLIEAMPEIIKEFPNVELEVIGDGNAKKEMEDMTKHLGIEDHVHFRGSVLHHKLPSYFAKADLFILPSLSEGFPLAVMEALSASLPTIVTDLPAYTQLKKDNVVTIIPIKDAHAIAVKVKEMLQNANIDSIRKKSRKYAVDHFDWEKVVTNYTHILKST
jgi:glycosyltransferase involved in cell wall biosynthesis